MKLLCGICLGVLAATASPGCDRDAAPAAGAASQPSAAATTPVVVSAVERLTIDRTVEAVGTLLADQDAVISAKVPGRVLSVHGEVGDRVAPDALLAQIDPTDYRMAVDQRVFALKQTLSELGLTELPGGDFDPASVPTVQRARFEVDNARSRLERVRKLFEVPQPLIPEQEFTDRKTEYEVAERNLAVAELAARSLLAQARTRDAERAAAAQRLADASVRTPPPAAGQDNSDDHFAIAERLVTTGEYVREGDPLFRVVDDSTIRFRAAVAERFTPDLALNQTVRLHVDGQPREFVGKVARISPAIDTATRTFQIEADFANSDRLLRPGAFGRARIIVGRQGDIVAVPASAVVSFAGIDRVFSVVGGRAVEHRVTPVPAGSGPTTRPGSGLVLLQGLPPEVTSVVTQGAARLARGVAVEVKPATAPTTAPAGVSGSR